MPQRDIVDFFGRIQSFWDIFGVIGFLVIGFFAFISIAMTIRRGPGFLFCVLFITYSVGAITQGGILFISTLIRWGCLFLMLASLLRGAKFPKPSIWFFGCYIFLGLIFIAFSSYQSMAIQRGVLLVTTYLAITITTQTYIKSNEDIKRLFKMGIIAGCVWAISNSFFLGEFMRSTETRFIAEGTAGTGVVAYAGAFFAPMIIWGIVQKQEKKWRVLCMVSIIPLTLLLIACGVRSALFGMVFIAPLPLILLRVKISRLISMIILVGVISTVVFLTFTLLFPEKSDYLIGRILSTHTTGRAGVWQVVFDHCIKSPFKGRGLGSSGVDGLRKFNLMFHNSYLSMWYDAGLLGLLLVTIFLFIYLVRGFHLICSRLDEETSNLARIAWGYLLGVVCMGFFESTLAGAGKMSVVILLMSAVIIDRIRQMRLEQEDIYYYQIDQMTGGYIEYDSNGNEILY